MKKGHFDSKKGGNVLFQKTESESWGLPLMNGGLKSKITYEGEIIDIDLTVSWEREATWLCFSSGIRTIFVIGYILCHPLIVFHLIWKNKTWLVFTIYVLT